VKINHTKSWFPKSIPQFVQDRMSCHVPSTDYRPGSASRRAVSSQCVRTYVRLGPGLAAEIHIASRTRDTVRSQPRRSTHPPARVAWAWSHVERVGVPRGFVGISAPRHALSLVPSRMVCGSEPAPSPLRKIPPLIFCYTIFFVLGQLSSRRIRCRKSITENGSISQFSMFRPTRCCAGVPSYR
jgi:hypothetical protein